MSPSKQDNRDSVVYTRFTSPAPALHSLPHHWSGHWEFCNYFYLKYIL